MTYNFSSYQEKYKSREETIINMYDRLYHRSRIDGDYITMSAIQADDNGGLLPKSELSQLLSSKFLTADQFHGVDIDSETIEINKRLGIGNWYVSDIFKFIENHIDDLNPSVINLDTVHMGNRCSDLISEVLLLLTEKNIKNCMVPVNIMMSNPHNKIPIHKIDVNEQKDVFLSNLSKDYGYSCAVLNGGWDMWDEVYYYSSTNSTIMGTFIFYS